MKYKYVHCWPALLAALAAEEAAQAAQQARGTIELPLAQSIDDEAESALIALGYKPQDATRAIKKVRVEGQTLEVLLKAALKNML